MIVANLQRLPRLMTLHQLSRRAGVHRARITALMLRGQLQPFALQDAGNGREQFLFAADAVQTVARLIAVGRTGNAAASHPLL